MQYHVIPTSFCVAYQSPRGEWISVTETGSAQAAERHAAELNAKWAAEQAKAQKQSQRFVPPAQRRPVRSFPDDAYA